MSNSNVAAENKFKIGDVVRYTGTASYVSARWQKSFVFLLDNRRVYTEVNGHSTWFYYHDLELMHPSCSFNPCSDISNPQYEYDLVPSLALNKFKPVSYTLEFSLYTSPPAAK